MNLRSLWGLICLGAIAVGARVDAGPTDAPTRRLTAAPAPPATPRSRAELGAHMTGTNCGLCHLTSAWKPAKFAHERTGFPLEGAHSNAECKACHVKDLTTQLPMICIGCHDDAHNGGLGQRCERCHTPERWELTFTVDAHRKTNFPLIGRHAAVPCSECHNQRRDYLFSRGTVGCYGCHRADYESTATGASGLNHATLGFGTECRQCHGPWTFRSASFPGHDHCFQTSRGVHAGFPCLTCHSTLTGIFASPGTCTTGTPACTSCHTHACVTTDAIHQSVLGYQCRDRKCYDCHQFTTRAP